MPIAITPTDVTNVAPELAQETTERLELFIEYARLFVCEEKFGAKAKLAIILYAAHLLTMSNKGGIGGQITSERVGELSRNYGQATGKEADDLAQTSYGLMFLKIRKGLLITPLVV